VVAVLLALLVTEALLGSDSYCGIGVGGGCIGSGGDGERVVVMPNQQHASKSKTINDCAISIVVLWVLLASCQGRTVIKEGKMVRWKQGKKVSKEGRTT
jgi:hypothetical protein